MINPLTWLRAAVKAAVLAGIGDALVVLDGTDNDQAAQQLLSRLQPALPAPEEDAPPARKRKGD